VELGSSLEEAIGGTPRRAANRPLASEDTDDSFHALVAKAVEGLVVIDEGGTISYMSPGVNDVLGADHDLTGQNLLHLINAEDAAAVRGAVASVLARADTAVTIEFRAQHADGAWPWLEARVTNLVAERSVRGIALNLRDISERKNHEDDLRHRALHDTLTGLPNRRLLLDRLHGAIGRSGRDSRSVALFFLDLDSFKDVNDSLGHVAGDEVLVGVGRRLASVARTQDTVARYGGDEFVVVVEHDQDPDWVAAFADRLRAVFREPVRADQTLVNVTASFGIATANKGNTSPEALLRDADAAMYRAKQGGGDAYTVFDDSMIDTTVVDLTTE
jgi:diguanylate cyclase (GGDEF)-like protein/PAS domain S-box-containing protein